MSFFFFYFKKKREKEKKKVENFTNLREKNWLPIRVSEKLMIMKRENGQEWSFNFR